ncbi:hypothetical protein PtrM4_047650 [Pyrenophora tritici-repentis]|uniref:Uncharacterized protein n=1 Tax=Pyrenophora tritici-repentis TaxID=45151 RepID=A0A834RJN2_9PLEO|nr:hypothetical protein PtrM4_047650 [Pyrenophora tritici-repentis]KAI0569647.1 hypothetical protein Alg215_11513 [Pyrenophora tritici-repentis]
MLFRSQVLFAFLASIAVVRGAERGGKYAYTKENCTSDEVAFCQAQAELENETYEDCKYFSAEVFSTHGELGSICMWYAACDYLCNPGARRGNVLR